MNISRKQKFAGRKISDEKICGVKNTWKEKWDGKKIVDDKVCGMKYMQ